ncbi:hypothetical protein [Telluribacter sp.]|jgi:tetratricopeptide (TPR) repeat protein|uniref:tetratricopeptide repeat protein n=1 Tax=Telluribacter sp. TaxID=1978767 RepID=UPI002E0FFAA7|nr:hypothetical protein [Telluribacter sp.]
MKAFLNLLLFLFGTGSLVVAQNTPLTVTAHELLQLDPPRRILKIEELYRKAWQTDTTTALRLRHEWEKSISQQGNERDLLILHTALLNVDRSNRYDNESFLKKATALLHQANKLPDEMIVAKLHLMLGLYYFNILHNYHLAFTHYLKTYELIQDKTESSFPERNYSIYILARAYYEFFDYEKAIALGSILLKQPPAKIQNTHIYTACLLGKSYQKLNKHQEARKHFQWSLRQLPVEEFNNDVWVGILTAELGVTYYDEERYAEAQPLLARGLELADQEKVWDYVAVTGARLALIALKNEQSQKAIHYAQQAHQAALRTANPKFSQETYSALVTCYQQAGQADLALLYADSAANAKELWKKDIDITMKHKAEMAAESERHQLREALLQNEKERQEALRNVLLGMVGLGMVIALLLFNRQALKNKSRQQQLLTQKQLAELELTNATRQLQDFTDHIRQKNELIGQATMEMERMHQELQELKSQITSGAAVDYQSLQQLEKATLLTDDDWARFTELFEKVHAGFFHRLKSKYPDLTSADIRYMALAKLNLNTKEMAGTLGVGPEAIRQHRSRLRRKLQLSAGTQLESLIEQV